jgi:hypothetical protein
MGDAFFPPHHFPSPAVVIRLSVRDIGISYCTFMRNFYVRHPVVLTATIKTRNAVKHSWCVVYFVMVYVSKKNKLKIRESVRLRCFSVSVSFS